MFLDPDGTGLVSLPGRDGSTPPPLPPAGTPYGGSTMGSLGPPTMDAAGLLQPDTPLLLVRPTEQWTSRGSQFRRLLVSLDGSEGSEMVLRYTRALSRGFESDIILLCVPETESEAPTLERYVARVASALNERGHRCRTLVTGSEPASTIVEVSQAEEADLIMMATRGRGAHPDRTNLGSVADQVVNATQVPLFLAPIRGTPTRGLAARDRALSGVDRASA